LRAAQMPLPNMVTNRRLATAISGTGTGQIGAVLEAAEAVDALHPFELDISGRAEVSGLGLRGGRVERRHWVGDVGHDLVGTEVSIRHSREALRS
jgi:hypothetical protein